MLSRFAFLGFSCCLVTLAPSDARAASVIVWSGSGDRAGGESALREFDQQHRVPLEDWGYQFTAGHPRVVDSGSMPGLNPGFHIVVIGVCEDAEAKRVAQELGAYMPGVYAKRVDATAGTCPSRSAENQGARRAPMAIAEEAALRDLSPSATWSLVAKQDQVELINLRTGKVGPKLPPETQTGAVTDTTAHVGLADRAAKSFRVESYSL